MITPKTERAGWLVFVPLLATAIYYALPASIQRNIWVTLTPQLVAYAALCIWTLVNTDVAARLHLDLSRLSSHIRWGAVIGLTLAAVNLSVILLVIPGLGGDIAFLRNTPHARAPAWAMFPLGILVIAILVELNFRGFQMGRLTAIFGSSNGGKAAAVLVSAMIFAWDPFMVRVFGLLHWMAFTDGLVWGTLLLRTRSLYATMAAHAVEVWILYAGLKLWFH